MEIGKTKRCIITIRLEWGERKHFSESFFFQIAQECLPIVRAGVCFGEKK